MPQACPARWKHSAALFVSENYLAAGCSHSRPALLGLQAHFLHYVLESLCLHHSVAVCLEKTAPYKELDW